jgi:hypothetical protein
VALLRQEKLGAGAHVLRLRLVSVTFVIDSVRQIICLVTDPFVFVEESQSFLQVPGRGLVLVLHIRTPENRHFGIFRNK